VYPKIKEVLNVKFPEEIAAVNSRFNQLFNLVYGSQTVSALENDYGYLSSSFKLCETGLDFISHSLTHLQTTNLKKNVIK